MRGFVAQEDDPPEANGVCRHGYFGWKNLDNAAYEEAIKSPHQIRQKQKERDQEAKKLEELKKTYEGKGREKGKSEDGEDDDFIPGGFNEVGGDPRFIAMKQIHEALAVADGADPSKVYGYGISQAALRGYEELREAWNKEVDPGEAFLDDKAKKLRQCIVTYQQQHRDDMGDQPVLRGTNQGRQLVRLADSEARTRNRPGQEAVFHKYRSGLPAVLRRTRRP